MAFTALMAYLATQVKLRYDFASMLPANDPAMVEYRAFKQKFGEDGNVLVIGYKSDHLFSQKNLAEWHRLGEQVRALQGIEEVVSVVRCLNLVRADSTGKLVTQRFIQSSPANRAEADSVATTINNFRFYHGTLLDSSQTATLMAVTIRKDFLDSRKRIALTDSIVSLIKVAEPKLGAHLHISGMPYIRSVLTSLVSNELRWFLLGSAVLAAVLMYAFFRSLKVVALTSVVVGMAVVWCFGIMRVLGYDITILTGIIPPLLVIIGVANCIFLLNRYQQGVRVHGSRALALARMVERVGLATMFTNLTTACGFATFAILKSEVLRQFGIVAALSIAGLFVLSLFLVPVLLSFLKLPKPRHLRHLDRTWSNTLIGAIVATVLSHRTKIYGVFALLTLLAAMGLGRLRATGNLVDDFPHHHPVMTDLRFFEENFGGVMPFEVEVDALAPGKALTPATIAKVEQLAEAIQVRPEFARALSVNEGLKFARQAYYNGLPEMYGLPTSSERAFILKAAERNMKGGMARPFIDSARQVLRLSSPMHDVGTLEMQRLVNEITAQADSIFPTENYKVRLTGTAVVFMKGMQYMVRNLAQSLALAVVLIMLLMALMFRSWRMVAVSLVPNLIPLLVTAGLMGWLNIAIKPSTVLVFSIAFGISVDDTVHFLAKYRQELALNNWDIKRSVILALREVGLSMIYTSVVLFFGFSIFTFSQFGGTQALGLLVSITLFVAMFSNLLLLPGLLLTFERALTTQQFSDNLAAIAEADTAE